MNNNLYEIIENKRQQLIHAAHCKELSSSCVLTLSQELDKLLNQYDQELKRASYS